MLNGWLDYHRATLVWKCEGLTDEQLRERSVPPSGLCLIGLVRHLTECKRGWFRKVLLGEDLPGLYWTPEDLDGDFDNVGSADTASVFAAFERECAGTPTCSASASTAPPATERPGLTQWPSLTFRAVIHISAMVTNRPR